MFRMKLFLANPHVVIESVQFLGQDTYKLENCNSRTSILFAGETEDSQIKGFLILIFLGLL